jgi:VWFA-related protein
MKKNIAFIILLMAFTLQLKLHRLNSNDIKLTKDQEQLKHEVAVVLKLVQVYVTDKNGNPVMDLENSDFILYEDRKLQSITDFERHISGPKKMLIEEKLEQTDKISSMLNRKFFILLDYGRNDIQGINKSKDAALHFIDTQLEPSDEIAVLSFSHIKGLILNEYLTANHHKAIEAIKKLRGILKIEEEPVAFKSAAESYLESGQLIEPSGAAIDEENSERMKAQGFARIIGEFAKSLRDLPGYKNIILFSAGLSRSLLYNFEFPEIKEELENTIKELAASNTPVFSVNTEGNRAYLKHERMRGDHSLLMLSDHSGGKYFPNVDQYDEIAKDIQAVTSNYYVLGYYIDEKWDGKYHEIKVEVKRQGYEVHAQGGYFNPKPFTEFSELEKHLHLLDLAMNRNSQFQLPRIFSSIALSSSNSEESNLVMISELPIESLKENTKGNTEVFTLIYNEDNNIADYMKTEIDFYTFLQKNIYLYSISSLAPGKYDCRLVIRDIKTGKGALASSSVHIPEESSSRLTLFPPLLLVPEKQALYLKLSKNLSRKKEKESKSIKDIYYYITNDFSPVVKELEREITKILAVVRCSIPKTQKLDIYFSILLFNHSIEKTIPLAHSLISSQKDNMGTDIFLLEITLPKLERGNYSMEFTAEQATTKANAKVRRYFDII